MSKEKGSQERWVKKRWAIGGRQREGDNEEVGQERDERSRLMRRVDDKTNRRPGKLTTSKKK